MVHGAQLLMGLYGADRSLTPSWNLGWAIRTSFEVEGVNERPLVDKQPQLHVGQNFNQWANSYILAKWKSMEHQGQFSRMLT